MFKTSLTKENMDTGWYEIFLYICYRVKSRNIANFGEVNSCLSEFRRVLESQKIEKGKMKIRVLEVSKFMSRKDDLETLACSNQIKISVVDESPNWIQNKNSKIDPLLHNHFKSLSLSKTIGKSNFQIGVIDTATPGEYRESHWPLEDLFKSQI